MCFSVVVFSFLSCILVISLVSEVVSFGIDCFCVRFGCVCSVVLIRWFSFSCRVKGVVVLLLFRLVSSCNCGRSSGLC